MPFRSRSFEKFIEAGTKDLFVLNFWEGWQNAFTSDLPKTWLFGMVCIGGRIDGQK
jgi:hypothetical protein